MYVDLISILTAIVQQLQEMQEIFRDPMAICNTYPELAELAANPDFVKKVNEIRDDLEKFELYANDEDVRTFYILALKRRAMEKMNPEVSYSWDIPLT